VFSCVLPFTSYFSFTEDERLAALEPTPEELGKLEELLAIEEFKEVPKEKGIRFLRARDLDIPATTDMLKTHLEWKERVRPESVTLDELGLAMESGCWRTMGSGKDGEPVLWCQVGRWNPHEYPVETYEKMVAYNMHQVLLLSRVPPLPSALYTGYNCGFFLQYFSVVN